MSQRKGRRKKKKEFSIKQLKALIGNIGIKKKEAEKNIAFISFVEKKFDLSDYEQVYDFCCGKGVLSTYFSLNGYVVIAIDNGGNNKRNQLAKRLNDSYRFINADLYDYNSLDRNSLVVSLHACGNLTDKVIELSLKSKNDFAIMSCCHGERLYFSPRELPDVSLIDKLGRDYYADLVRLNYILEQGYDAGIFEIPREITPKNRIIWGKKPSLAY